MWVDNRMLFIEIDHESIGKILLNAEKINSIQCDEYGIDIISDKESWHLSFSTAEEKTKSFKQIRDCLFGK